MIRLKRAYEPPAETDGQRVLVDRVWPRGVTKAALRLAAWPREIAPSTELRRWFNHDPERWAEFQQRYRDELAAPERQTVLADLAESARGGTLTLIYGARDREQNQAAVLRGVLEEHMGSAGRG